MADTTYYVTLYVKTETVTKATPWISNAKFEDLSSAENYRNSLIPIVDIINSSPANIDGERIIAITQNPALAVDFYRDSNEIEHESLGNLSDIQGVNLATKKVAKTSKRIIAYLIIGTILTLLFHK